MKYGNVELKYKIDSLSIVVSKSQDIRHYPGTDDADLIEKGRTPTKISCTLIAESKEKLMAIQQLLHASNENELHFNDFYYKKVVTSQQGSPKAKTTDEKVWEIQAEFAALDPIPYDAVTDEVLY